MKEKNRIIEASRQTVKEIFEDSGITFDIYANYLEKASKVIVDSGIQHLKPVINMPKSISNDIAMGIVIEYFEKMKFRHTLASIQNESHGEIRHKEGLVMAADLLCIGNNDMIKEMIMSRDILQIIKDEGTYIQVDEEKQTSDDDIVIPSTFIAERSIDINHQEWVLDNKVNPNRVPIKRGGFLKPPENKKNIEENKRDSNQTSIMDIDSKEIIIAKGLKKKDNANIARENISTGTETPIDGKFVNHGKSNMIISVADSLHNELSASSEKPKSQSSRKRKISRKSHKKQTDNEYSNNTSGIEKIDTQVCIMKNNQSDNMINVDPTPEKTIRQIDKLLIKNAPAIESIGTMNPTRSGSMNDNDGNDSKIDKINKSLNGLVNTPKLIPIQEKNDKKLRSNEDVAVAQNIININEQQKPKDVIHPTRHRIILDSNDGEFLDNLDEDLGKSIRNKTSQDVRQKPQSNGLNSNSKIATEKSSKNHSPRKRLDPIPIRPDSRFFAPPPADERDTFTGEENDFINKKQADQNRMK